MSMRFTLHLDLVDLADSYCLVVAHFWMLFLLHVFNIG